MTKINTIKAYKLKNGNEAYGYITTKKVDDTNPEIKVLQAIGYVGEGSLYLGDAFSYLSAVEGERDLTDDELKVFTAKANELREDSLRSISKIDSILEKTN